MRLPRRLHRLPLFRSLVLAAVVGVGVVGATPAHAAAVKTIKTTIAFPGTDSGTWVGAGYGNWTETGESMAVARQTCPAGGPLDGTIFKFIDLKGNYTHFKASGPPVLFTETVPDNPATSAIVVQDYDIDLYLLDAKCKRIDVAGANAAVPRRSRRRKPARYAVIVYWDGHDANLPVTLEYS